VAVTDRSHTVFFQLLLLAQGFVIETVTCLPCDPQTLAVPIDKQLGTQR
jgi:hypothetical protein